MSDTAVFPRSGPERPQSLFPYQEAGVVRLIGSRSVLLADEMGLGKTIQAIAALRLLRHRRELESALIVVPAGLVMQWRQQLRSWAADLRLSTVSGTANQRAAAWRAVADVYIVGYESLRSDIWLNWAGAPGTRDWDLVVLDEAQRIKTARSEMAAAIKRLQRKRAWALTGTPLENRIDDLISILDFVAPGRFDARTMAVGLRRLLGEVQIRRRRRDVLSELPPKLQSTVTIELGPRQRASYSRALNEGRVRLAALGRDVQIAHVLELLLRLKQICNFCPESGDSAKLDDLKERLQTMTETDEKGLVFSQFVDRPFGIKRLELELKHLSPIVITGDVDDATRRERIAEFDRDARRRLLLLSLRAGGVGLNLTSASYVFHFDRWWNPAVEVQAEDRTHRIGQTLPVNVYAYLCVDTIEEKVQEILSEKRALFADVIDREDLVAPGRVDLNALLGLLRDA